MPVEFITPDNLTKDLIKEILDAAYINASFDSDGDIVVREGVSCFLLLSKANDRIQLYNPWRFAPDSSLVRRMDLANTINKNYIIVKAISAGEHLRFEYDIPIEGGITPKFFILALKRFCAIPRIAIKELGEGIVA